MLFHTFPSCRTLLYCMNVLTQALPITAHCPHWASCEYRWHGETLWLLTPLQYSAANILKAHHQTPLCSELPRSELLCASILRAHTHILYVTLNISISTFDEDTAHLDGLFPKNFAVDSIEAEEKGQWSIFWFSGREIAIPLTAL